MNEDIQIVLADPEGSGVYNKVVSWQRCSDAVLTVEQVKHGVMFDRKEKEGTKRRHQIDTVVEGMYVFPPLVFMRGSDTSIEGSTG